MMLTCIFSVGMTPIATNFHLHSFTPPNTSCTTLLIPILSQLRKSSKKCRSNTRGLIPLVCLILVYRLFFVVIVKCHILISFFYLCYRFLKQQFLSGSFNTYEYECQKVFFNLSRIIFYAERLIENRSNMVKSHLHIFSILMFLPLNTIC